jgi:ureidoglycolate lyase
MNTIIIEPLSRAAFAEFGDVIEIAPETRSHPINAGTTERFHDLATIVATGEEARPIISIARAQPFSLPLSLNLLERHPHGSQAFIPLKPTRFLVIVAPHEQNGPGAPRAFMAAPGQAINYFLGTWHGVLTALDDVCDFLIVDREGEGDNLEEFHLPEPYVIKE